MDASSMIQNALKIDGLKTEVKTIINVIDDDDYIICEINITDKFINFNYGFHTKGCLIPIVKQLLDDGYDRNSSPTNCIHEIKRAVSPYISPELLTADQVRERYVFKDDHGNPIYVDDPRWRELFYQYRADNLFARDITNHLGDVKHCGDISDPTNHPQWFMTSDEWYRLRSRADKVIQDEVVEDVAEKALDTRMAVQVFHMLAKTYEYEIRIGLHDTTDFILGYKKSHLTKAASGHFNGTDEIHYVITDTRTGERWLMTSAEWSKIGQRS